jgi:hypothetical protein
MNIYEAVSLATKAERAGRASCYLRRRAWTDGRYYYAAAGTDYFRDQEGAEQGVGHRDCSADDWVVEDADGNEIFGKQAGAPIASNCVTPPSCFDDRDEKGRRWEGGRGWVDKDGNMERQH